MRIIFIFCLLFFPLVIEAKRRNYFPNWRIRNCFDKYEKIKYTQLMKFRNDHKKIITYLKEKYGITDAETTNDIIYCLLFNKYRTPKKKIKTIKIKK